MSGCIIHELRDGVHWRHEMDAETFDMIMRARDALSLMDRRRPKFTAILNTLELAIPNIRERIVSERVEFKADIRGLEPGVIFVDELIGRPDPAYESKPIPFENVPLMQFQKS